MICAVCKQAEYFLACDGCSLPVCEGSLQYGLHGTGCARAQPLCLCAIGLDDPGVNCG